MKDGYIADTWDKYLAHMKLVNGALFKYALPGVMMLYNEEIAYDVESYYYDDAWGNWIEDPLYVWHEYYEININLEESRLIDFWFRYQLRQESFEIHVLYDINENHDVEIQYKFCDLVVGVF